LGNNKTPTGIFSLKEPKTLRMKKCYPLLLTIMAVFSSLLLFAQSNAVIVQGYVKYANATPLVNHPVTISVDSLTSTPTCNVVHVRYTNANGFYRDTLTCNTLITKVRISTPGCNGTVLTENPTVNPNGFVERNFTLQCNPPQVQCVANFNFSVSGLTVSFVNTSTGSIAGGLTGYWNFGDGSSSTIGNPIHTYSAPGIYNVTLLIQSGTSCTDTIVKTIALTNTNATCTAIFTKESVPGAVRTFVFNSNQSSASANDSIISRKWIFYKPNSSWRDSIIGNQKIVTYTFPSDTGIYNVCLVIKTAGGCTRDHCQQIYIAPPPPTPTCEATFYANPLSATTVGGWNVYFNSQGSHGTSSTDSIISRTWIWGDGTTTTGNQVITTHAFAQNGTYDVCLIIKSASNCSDTVCKTITVPMQGQQFCRAQFNYNFTTNAARTVRFNSTASIAQPGDTIVSRKWEFGDGTVLTGNVVEPTHQYAAVGVYTVCLTIKTTRNCENRICTQVVVPQSSGNCVPYFTWQRIAPKKVAFNSSMSWTPTNDSIVERKWNFGDGSPILGGNVVSPQKEYAQFGNYNVCLKIRTALGCVRDVCIPVRVQDSNVVAPTPSPIKILSVYPVPCTVQLTTVVWSQNNNVQATLAIYDIYGVLKWSTNKLLLQGNNITVIPTAQLLSGPYFFKVTTMYGTQSKNFYKL
jgi:PKD repeat protein